MDRTRVMIAVVLAVGISGGSLYMHQQEQQRQLQQYAEWRDDCTTLDGVMYTPKPGVAGSIPAGPVFFGIVSRSITPGVAS